MSNYTVCATFVTVVIFYECKLLKITPACFFPLLYFSSFAEKEKDEDRDGPTDRIDRPKDIPSLLTHIRSDCSPIPPSLNQELPVSSLSNVPSHTIHTHQEGAIVEVLCVGETAKTTMLTNDT